MRSAHAAHIVHDDDAFAAEREALLDAAARLVYEERSAWCVCVCVYSEMYMK